MVFSVGYILIIAHGVLTLRDGDHTFNFSWMQVISLLGLTHPVVKVSKILCFLDMLTRSGSLENTVLKNFLRGLNPHELIRNQGPVI
jgi:hypothetical protein